MGSAGIRWDPMDPLGSDGIRWDPMGSDGIRWDPLGSDDFGDFLITIGSHRIPGSDEPMKMSFPQPRPPL